MYKPICHSRSICDGSESLKISSYFDQLYTSVYLGFGALLLSFAGFFVKQARFSSMMTLVFTVMCLGPRIFWSASEYVTYSWLYHFVTLATPYMSGLDEPFEFVVIASFFSTVSVGIVLQHIWQKSKKAAGTIGFLLLSLHFFGNPAPTPVKIAKVPYQNSTCNRPLQNMNIPFWISHQNVGEQHYSQGNILFQASIKTDPHR